MLAENTEPLDYGPLVILRHETDCGEEFFTLYGHLARQTLQELKPGQAIAAGQVFARVGTLNENGGWPAHLHLQIILDLLELGADFPGVARPLFALGVSEKCRCSVCKERLEVAFVFDPGTLKG